MVRWTGGNPCNWLGLSEIRVPPQKSIVSHFPLKNRPRNLCITFGRDERSFQHISTCSKCCNMMQYGGQMWSKTSIPFLGWSIQIHSDDHPIAPQGCRCLTTRWTNNSAPSIPSRECHCCSVTAMFSVVFSTESLDQLWKQMKAVHLEEMRTLSVGAGQASRGAGWVQQQTWIWNVGNTY